MPTIGEPLNIQWKRGTFHTFYALAKIRVGGATELSINAGDEFEYDGSILKYEGREIPQPSLRGSFRQGWVSDVAPDGDVHIPAHQALRNVAKSTSVNRDLSNVQRTGPRSITSDSLDEDTVLNVSDRSAVRTQEARGGGRGHLTAEHNRRARGMEIHPDEVEAQEGVSIGRIRTSTHLKANVMNSRSAGLKDKLENLTGSGFIRDRSAPVLERSTGTVVHKEGVSIKTNVGSVDRRVRPEAGSDGVEVGRVRHTDKRGGSGDITVQDTSNIRAERAAKASAKPATTYKVDTKLSPKVRVARAIDPTFPEDWSFEGKLADRLAAVKAHGPNPRFLEALYAAEGDQMRKALSKAFPQQFGG